MEHQKQVETVKKALELSCQIQNTKDKIVQLRQEQFRDVPAAPVKKIAEYKDPEIMQLQMFIWKEHIAKFILMYLKIMKD